MSCYALHSEMHLISVHVYTHCHRSKSHSFMEFMEDFEKRVEWVQETAALLHLRQLQVGHFVLGQFFFKILGVILGSGRFVFLRGCLGGS